MAALLQAVQHLDLTGNGVAARARLAAVLRRVDAAGGSGWPDDRSPFPGLRPFDTDLHRAFFGRTHEIEQLAALLRSPGERAEGAVLILTVRFGPAPGVPAGSTDVSRSVVPHGPILKAVPVAGPLQLTHRGKGVGQIALGDQGVGVVGAEHLPADAEVFLLHC
jgi:hypothetical protein